MPDAGVVFLQPPWAWLVVVTVGVLLTLTLWGCALLRLRPGWRLGHGAVPFVCQGLVVGVLLYCLAAMAGVALRIGLVQTFCAGSAMVAAVAAIAGFRRRRPGGGAAGVDATTAVPTAGRRMHVLALCLIVVGSVLWSVDNLQGFRSTQSGAVLVPWVDILFHARQIGNFAAFAGNFGGLHLSMYGEPLAPYHYAGYMVPALVTTLSGAAPFQVATSVYPVLGMLLTGAAMLVLAQSSAGAATALLATVLLFFLPDPTTWFPTADKYTSYFFFQQVGIGGAYAVGVIGLALAHALRGIEVQSRASCVLSLCLFTAAALFKLQIFLAYGLFIFLLVIGTFPRSPRAWRVAAAVACILGYAALVWAAGRVPNAPTLALSSSGLAGYLAPMARAVSGSEHPASAFSYALLPLAPLWLFLSVYGLLFPAAVWLAWVLRKDADSRTTILLLATFLLAHAYVRLLIADNRGMGDIAEINRKTFVLPYFVVVYGVARLWSRYLERRPAAVPGRWVQASAACGLLALTAFSATGLQHATSARGRTTQLLFPWGLLSASAYLTAHSARFDVAQLCENDNYNALATLSDRPVYVARLIINAGAETAVERGRFARVRNGVQQPDLQQARAVLEPAGIRWLLMSPACQAAWETALAPAFASGGWRLYDLASR